ncbi:XRE family transcriptional regulator [Clostridium estertheticum]|uniref:XRE family transcriptional regulator n=1 Tax=Clostridium estertheticum TaxID=238834 RepID=UPI001C7D875A|nr:XRE family transcriptional regulator [Clostridium estertheticum]MBX4266483.1 XRE family transcriptional regulator [Clostridium estertheticum]WLC88175.1 XRE family transcriptional regulator [Clostridium estertheticum]
MKNKTAFNGERLKSARVYRGLTVAELAEKLELQRQTVSMYENNKLNNPELTTIANMSRVLGFPKKFFLENDESILKNGSTYFRALLTTSKKYRNEQIQKVDFIARIYRYLNDYIEFPLTNLPQENYESSEAAAISLRKFWNLGDKPVDNIIYLVEENGILVTMFDTNTGDIDAFSQLITVDKLETYLIGCSRNKGTAARIHFDVAHELGHILLHEWSEDIETLSKDEFKEKEKEANAFASAFLLPRNAFIKDVGVYADNLAYYVELKKKWKVSISAMIRRSYNLGLIDSSIYQQLMRTMQKRGIKKKEPLDDNLYTAPPSVLRTSVQMLLEEGVLTTKEFIDELSQDYGLSLESCEIENLLDLPKDTLKVVNVSPVHNLVIKSRLIDKVE